MCCIIIIICCEHKEICFYMRRIYWCMQFHISIKSKQKEWKITHTFPKCFLQCSNPLIHCSNILFFLLRIQISYNIATISQAHFISQMQLYNNKNFHFQNCKSKPRNFLFYWYVTFFPPFVVGFIFLFICCFLFLIVDMYI